MWGVLVHLVIPPFVFMVTEEWDYIEGFYYSFITISTIGFGDFVAGEFLPCSLPTFLVPASVQLALAGEPGRHSGGLGHCPSPVGFSAHPSVTLALLSETS